MATYKITHKEELIGWFYVEANSKEEALKEFKNGSFDFSDMELIDSQDEAELEDDQDV